MLNNSERAGLQECAGHGGVQVIEQPVTEGKKPEWWLPGANHCLSPVLNHLSLVQTTKDGRYSNSSQPAGIPGEPEGIEIVEPKLKG